MMRSVVALCGCLFFALLGATSSASAQPSPIHSSLQSKIDEIVAPYVTARDFQGVVGVQRDGEAPLIVPYGFASVELEHPHEQNGIFMIGSVSKQFTAVAILLLEQDGHLSTDDLVSRHLPTFPHGAQITIEQLLTHTSGVADVYSLKSFGQTRGQGGPFESVIDEIGQMDLTHMPGSTYAYSNGGYSLLAALVERTSGMSYGEYLERRIFAPLGMTSSSHDTPGAAVKGRVPGYDPWRQNELTPTKPIAAAYSMGSGSIWSSAADLLTWTKALHNGRVLSEAAYKKLIHDYGHGYGYGVSTFTRFGRDVIGHDGRVAGYASDLARYLEDRVTIVVLSNVQSVSRDQIRRLVAAATFGETYETPEPKKFLRPTGSLAEFVGVYSFGPAFNVTITESDGRLLARANEGGTSELILVSEAEWFSRVLYATVRFGRDETGSVDQLIWGRSDQAPVGRKIQ